MANPEHLARLLEGSVFFDDWRKRHPEVKVDLSGADFASRDFRWRLSGVNLRGAILRCAQFFISEDRGANLVNTDLREADMREVVLERADLTGASLNKADLRGANLSGVNAREVQMNEANLESAQFQGANMGGADLSFAKLWKANLRHAQLQLARLIQADMRCADLADAELGEATFNSANLRFANLHRANLCGADLRAAHLDQADLSEANLTGATLFRAGLTLTNMSRAVLRGADLRAATLLQAKLNEAILSNAMLWETQRTGWEINGIVCKRTFWDKDAQEPTSYEPGEFEKLYAEQTFIELFYQGGVSKFELNTLPAMLHHLASLYPGTNIRLKSIEETGGGAKISISVGDSGAETVERIRADAIQVHQAQLALRDNEILRLETEKKYLESFVSERLIKAMLAATTQQNVFNAPVYGVALSSGSSSAVVNQTMNDNAGLLVLLEKILELRGGLRLEPADAEHLEAEVDSANAELAKSQPNPSVLSRSLKFVQEIAREGVKKGGRQTRRTSRLSGLAFAAPSTERLRAATQIGHEEGAKTRAHRTWGTRSADPLYT